MSDKQAFYVTTPIYYVNAKPHLGHAYTSTVTDCVTRYQRLSGKDSRMITGSDEHGDKIVQAAEKQGLTAQQLADGVSAEFQALLPKLGVEHSRFVRTSSPEHKANVRKFLQTVYDKGDIYFGEYGGHYCYGCERFYTEKELLEDGTCPQHLTKPEYISEKNYFFRMSKYSGWLKEYIQANPDFIRPERYRNEVLALLDSGELEDLCISRPKSRLTWGIELPFDADYVCYVWFDALVSYITALDWAGEHSQEPGSGELFKKYWPAAQHIIAKDILKPHAIFWPTMLKSAGLEIYRHLNVHGYWLVRDTKMSKSLGNVVDPLKMIETYGLDVFRYFVMREMHFGNDGSFTEDGLIQRQNADLANDLGNLFSRVLSMNAKYFNSVTPEPGVYGEEEKRIQALASEALRNYQSLFDNFRFSGALESLWELVRALNKYVDTAAPWTLAKEGKTAELGTVMYTLLECMRKIALHLWPVMPGSASKMLGQLGQGFDASAPGFGFEQGVDLAAEAESFGSLKPGATLAASSNLFPRLDVPKQENAAGKKNGKDGKTGQAACKNAASNAAQAVSQSTPQAAQGATTGGVPAIEFSDFQKLDLRVGTILSAEKHPDADKLLCFKVDVGEESPRSIVSGIAEFFKPEELTGKQVIVVANLPPRKIRKIESQGMLLTAEDENGLSLLSPGAARKPGTKIS